MSNSNKPQTALLVTIILVIGLPFLKGIIGMRVCKKSIVDVLQRALYLNVLAFAVFSLYDFSNHHSGLIILHRSTICWMHQVSCNSVVNVRSFSF